MSCIQRYLSLLNSAMNFNQELLNHAFRIKMGRSSLVSFQCMTMPCSTYPPTDCSTGLREGHTKHWYSILICIDESHEIFEKMYNISLYQLVSLHNNFAVSGINLMGLPATLGWSGVSAGYCLFSPQQNAGHRNIGEIFLSTLSKKNINSV